MHAGSHSQAKIGIDEAPENVYNMEGHRAYRP